jgi:hypothetical protein
LVSGNVRLAADRWQATNARTKAGLHSFADKITPQATGE